MNPPTATPRTDDEETPLITNHRVSAETYKRMVDLARTLETELVAAKAECNRLYESSPTALDALTAELARLRAELAVAENWVEHHSQHADDLIAENVKLRADLQRFTGHGLLDCHAICDQRDAAVAERDQLRAEVERLTVACNNFSNAEIAEGDWKARAERAEVERDALAAEREKVRVLRSALERRHDEQSYYCQYVEDALAATKEGSK